MQHFEKRINLVLLNFNVILTLHCLIILFEITKFVSFYRFYDICISIVPKLQTTTTSVVTQFKEISCVYCITVFGKRFISNFLVTSLGSNHTQTYKSGQKKNTHSPVIKR